MKSNAKMDFYKFSFAGWEYFEPNKNSPYPIYLPQGQLEVTDNIIVLESDSSLIESGKLRILLMDFSMKKNDKKPFYINWPYSKATIQCDFIEAWRGDPIFTFRVKDFNQNRADWVFYATKKSGIIGSYVSCAKDSNEIVLSYIGKIYDTDLDFFQYEPTGSCQIEH